MATTSLGDLIFTLSLDDKTFASAIDKNKSIVTGFSNAVAKSGTAIHSSFKLAGDSVAVWGKSAEKVTNQIGKLKETHSQLGTELAKLKEQGMSPAVIAATDISKKYTTLGETIKGLESKYVFFGSATEALTAKQTQLKNQIINATAQGLSPQSKKLQDLQKDYKQTSDAIDSINFKSKSLGEQVGIISKGMMQFGAALTAGVTVPLGILAAKMLDYASNMQFYQASFEVMLGSATRATKIINDLRVMAAKTPFEMKDLTAGARTLVQFGEEADTVMKTVQVLGDIAQGNNERFQALSLAYAQMSSAGRLLAQDLYQMVNAGFNPLLVISKNTGKSLMDLREEMKEGKITTDMVKDAFYQASAAGGQFFQGMERASKTLKGLVSTMKDDLSQMGLSFTTLFLPKVMETVKGISTFAKWVTDLNPELKAGAVSLGIFAAAIGPIILGIGTLGVVWSAFKKANPEFLVMGLVATGVLAVAAAFITLNAVMKQAQIEQVTADTLKRMKELAAEGKNIVQIVSIVSKETGLTVEKVADIARENKLVTEEYEEQVDTTVKQNALFDKQKGSVNDIALGNKAIKSALEGALTETQYNVEGTIDLKKVVKDVASEYGVSETRVGGILLNVKSLTKEQKDALQSYIDINYQLEKSYDLETLRLVNSTKSREMQEKIAKAYQNANSILVTYKEIVKPTDQIAALEKVRLSLKELGLDYVSVYAEIEKTISGIRVTQETSAEKEKKRAEEEKKQITDRKQALADYKTEYDRIAAALAKGYLTPEQATEEQISATRTYISALEDLNYIGVKHISVNGLITNAYDEGNKERTRAIGVLKSLGAEYSSSTAKLKTLKSATEDYEKAMEQVKHSTDTELETNKAQLSAAEKYKEALVDLGLTETADYNIILRQISGLKTLNESVEKNATSFTKLQEAIATYNLKQTQTNELTDQGTLESMNQQLDAVTDLIMAYIEYGDVTSQAYQDLMDRREELMAQEETEELAVERKKKLTEAEEEYNKTVDAQKYIKQDAIDQLKTERDATKKLIASIVNYGDVTGDRMKQLQIQLSNLDSYIGSMENAEKRTEALVDAEMKYNQALKVVQSSTKGVIQDAKDRVSAIDSFLDELLLYKDASDQQVQSLLKERTAQNALIDTQTESERNAKGLSDAIDTLNEKNRERAALGLKGVDALKQEREALVAMLLAYSKYGDYASPEALNLKGRISEIDAVVKAQELEAANLEKVNKAREDYNKSKDSIDTVKTSNLDGYKLEIAATEQLINAIAEFGDITSAELTILLASRKALEAKVKTQEDAEDVTKGLAKAEKDYKNGLVEIGKLETDSVSILKAKQSNVRKYITDLIKLGITSGVVFDGLMKDFKEYSDALTLSDKIEETGKVIIDLQSDIAKETDKTKKVMLESILASIQGWLDEGLTIDQIKQKIQGLKDSYTEAQKAMVDGANEFEKTVNQIISAGQGITTALSSAPEDFATDMMGVAADIASLFGPEGQAVAAVIRGMQAIQNFVKTINQTLFGDYETAMSVIASVQQAVRDAAFENEEKLHNQALSNIETRRDAELAAAGLIDETQEQMAAKRKAEAETDLTDYSKKMDLEIAELQDQYNAETSVRRKAQIQKEIEAKKKEKLTEEERLKAVIVEAQKAVDKAAINAKYDAEKLAATEAFEAKKRKYEYETAVYQKELALAQLEISRGQDLGKLGLLQFGKRKEVKSLYDDLRTLISNTPLPALASGAIALPRPGGQVVNVAEGGMAEAIIPLNRINEVLRSISPEQTASPRFDTADVGDIHLVVNLDSKPILSKIFSATKNRTVLISQGAVV